MLHRAAGDRAVGQLLDLPHENVDRRLGHDDEVADEHTDGNDDPVAGKSRDDAAEVVARGHEADVHAGEENDEPEVCIRKAHADADELLALDYFSEIDFYFVLTDMISDHFPAFLLFLSTAHTRI